MKSLFQFLICCFNAEVSQLVNDEKRHHRSVYVMSDFDCILNNFRSFSKRVSLNLEDFNWKEHNVDNMSTFGIKLGKIIEEPEPADTNR